MTDKSKTAEAGGAEKQQADPAAKAPPSGMTAAQVQKMIDDSIAKVDFGQHVDTALDAREQRQAEAAAAAEKDAQDKAAAEQAKARNAAKKADSALEKAEAEATKKRATATDRARREYAELTVDAVPSSASIASEGAAIELRLGDGSTFLPEFAVIDIAPDRFADESGRPVYLADLVLPTDLVGFTASEAFLLVEAKGEPIALYRCEIMALPVGGGRHAEIRGGSLAFRKLSPEPAAAPAA